MCVYSAVDASCNEHGLYGRYAMHHVMKCRILNARISHCRFHIFISSVGDSFGVLCSTTDALSNTANEN